MNVARWPWKSRTFPFSSMIGISAAASWAPRMLYILRNVLLALVEQPQATLLDVPRMLVDEAFRRHVVSHLSDELVREFWRSEFAGWHDRYRTEAIAPIQNRVRQLLTSPLLRQVFAPSKRSLDLRQVMDVCYHLGLRLRVEITRTEFEEATIDLLERAEAITSQITAHARLDWSKIDRVLAVGGASRMPMFTQMLATVTGKKPDRSLSADEAVAQGAAIYCGMLIEDGSDRGSRHNLVNVNFHSPGAVGLDLTTGQARNCILIPRNTALPCCVTRVFRTARHNQRSVALNIRQQLDAQYMQIARTVVAARSGLPPELDRKRKQLVDVANDAATAQHQLNKLAFGARPAQAAVERIQRGTQIARLKQKLNECCQQERLLQVALGRLAIEARIALPNNSRELVAIRQLQSMRHANS